MYVLQTTDIEYTMIELRYTMRERGRRREMPVAFNADILRRVSVGTGVEVNWQTDCRPTSDDAKPRKGEELNMLAYK